ncbi:hypothetical protein KR018_008426 [Drosophila ironensis]|nr:hypothetical protein KR018_008426 [Drosophila ironensis]
MATARPSRLLATAYPYLQVFSLFSLTPPPQSFGRTSHERLRKYLMVGYACYALLILGLVFFESFANIRSINAEVVQYNLESFTKVMGHFQKSLLSVMIVCNHLNMLINYRRLGRIYKEISDLETAIEDYSQCFGSQSRRHSFRLRMALGVGVWLVCVVALLPRLTFESLGPFMNRSNKILTEFILVMQQLKALEYCVFVMLLHELVLRLRHTLWQLQLEMVDHLQHRDMLQALCVALKRNQLLVGRVWRLEGEVSSYFCLPMILLFLYNGVTILHLINWAFINTFIADNCCKFERFGTCLLFLANLLVTCFLSQLCIDDYNSFSRIVHQIDALSGGVDFPKLTMGLREYSLQMQHLKVSFTCGGFFNINLKNFGGMVIMLLSYIVILLQFKIQSIAEKNYAMYLNNSLASNKT